MNLSNWDIRKIEETGRLYAPDENPPQSWIDLGTSIHEHFNEEQKKFLRDHGFNISEDE